jgi:hypothetical protein
MGTNRGAEGDAVTVAELYEKLQALPENERGQALMEAMLTAPLDLTVTPAPARSPYKRYVDIPEREQSRQ